MSKVLKPFDKLKNRIMEGNQTHNGERTPNTGIHKMVSQFAGTFIGQAVMYQIEKLLWSLEKTTAWISHGKTDGKKSKTPKSLVRPLPWILFLPALLVVRYTRVVLSLVSICLGFDEIEASTMVSFLYETRQSVHAIVRKANHGNNKTKDDNSRFAPIRRFLSMLAQKVSGFFGRPAEMYGVPNNKTLLNAVEDEFESESDYDSDDSEDKAYTNLLGASLREESDTDDDDFVCDVNGTSDLESELSEYSEHASDEELAVQNQEEPASQIEQEEKKITENGGNGAHVPNSDVESVETDKESQGAYEPEQQQQEHQANELRQDKPKKHKATDSQVGNHNDKKPGNSTAHSSNNRQKHNNRNNKNGRHHEHGQNNGQHGVDDGQNSNEKHSQHNSTETIDRT